MAVRDYPGSATMADPTVTLSKREFQVLLGISNGMTNLQIADKLGLSEDTVKIHVRRLLSKVHARDRAHAVRRGFELEMLIPFQGDSEAPLAPRLQAGTPRRPLSDVHIAACFSAEACPCRAKENRS